MKGDNQHFEVNTWLCGPSPWICREIYGEWVRTRKRPFPSKRSSLKMSVHIYIHQSCLYLNHVVCWCDVIAHFVECWKKMHCKCAEHASRITDQFPLCINHCSSANAHEGTEFQNPHVAPPLLALPSRCALLKSKAGLEGGRPKHTQLSRATCLRSKTEPKTTKVDKRHRS